MEFQPFGNKDFIYAACLSYDTEPLLYRIQKMQLCHHELFQNDLQQENCEGKHSILNN